MFNYNYYKNLEYPLFYLAYPSIKPKSKIVGALHVYDAQNDFYLNSIDTLNFKVYKYENGNYTDNYHLVKVGMYILEHGVGWYVITNAAIKNSGGENECIEVQCNSLEYLLTKTNLTSFGALGVETDEQGGLDLYSLYMPADVGHSILHIVVEKNPAWSIGYVDSKIISEYRSFSVDTIDTYTFLTNNVSSVFDCVFQFNSSEMTISAYALDSIGKNTDITLNYNTLLKTVDLQCDESNIKTMLHVSGGNDARTNTVVDIASVNPGGGNIIFNPGFFLGQMSLELKTKWLKYIETSEANQKTYQAKQNTLKTLYDELGTLNTKLPSAVGSTNWTQYGLTGLQSKSKEYKEYMSLYTSPDNKSLYASNKALYDAVEKEIVLRRNQIKQKEQQISNTISEIQSLIVRLEDFMGSELYKELSLYIREDDFCDDSFVVTTEMTDKEVLEMQQALLSHAKKELEKVCYPRFTMEVDLINFTQDFNYQYFTEQIELGNIIHIDYNGESIFHARLLKLHMNWDDTTDFKMTFSNRNSLDETVDLLEEIRSQAAGANNKLTYNTGGWSQAKQSSVEFNEYRNSVFDASKQQLVSSSNQEVLIDSTGAMFRKWHDDLQRFDDIQLWLTNRQICFTTNNWNTVSLAIGHIKMGNSYFYGVNAEVLLGKITLTEQLYISNASGNYTFTKDGFLATNGAYQVKINPNTPSDIFSISISNKKLLYVDTTNQKLKFEGDIESKSGHIASYVITGNSLTSGNVGMCSDTSAGAVTFWAGNSNKNSAPFRVTNQGKVVCSNIDITGGSLKIGSNFSVDSTGKVKAVNGDFSGKITATSGKIGGWNINGDTLQGSSGGSYIKGGEINIGSGFFRVYEDEIRIGDFIMAYSSRGLFMSEDEYSGISAHTSGERFAIWAAYNGGGALDVDNYGFAVNAQGSLYCKEIYVRGNSWWEGWSLTRTLRSLQTRIQDAEDAINDLRDSMP